MLKQKSMKKGHRRQISKQLIKRRLMEDLYPIPRQKDMTSRIKMKSALNMKFTNTLQFLEYNQVQELMLQKFQEKLEYQLQISIPFLEIAVQDLKIDGHIYNTIKKLVGFHKRTMEINEDQLLYSLKNLCLTARQEIKVIIKLLLFYYFFWVNIKEYKTVLRQFTQKNIFSLTQTMIPGKSQLIISKILSSIYIILIKFNQTQEIVKIGKNVIQHRKNLQRQYFNQQHLQITKQHARTTLFFKIKYFQSLLKHEKDPYEIMNILHDELLQMKKRPNDGHIGNDVIQLYIDELMKIKKIVQPRIESDFYHVHHSEEKFIEKNKNRDKVQIAIKEFKRRKSMNFVKNNKDNQSSIFVNDNESLKSFQQDKNLISKPQKQFRRIYNPSSKQQVQIFSKYTSQGTLKKSRKNSTQSFFRQSSQAALNSPKVDLKIVEQLSKQAIQTKMKSNSKQKQVNPHLFLKLNSLFQITKKYMNKNDEKQMKIQKLEKKRKIEQIYQNFTNLNKIVREIPWRQLDRQTKLISKTEIGSKHEIKQIYSNPIINFPAGILNKNYQINSILNNKGCLQLEFIKTWLGQLYKISLKIQLQDQKFILNIHLNNSRYNIVLNRGSNVLCERYVTIWPTIRYLVNKRLYQFSVFKRYEGLLLIKKMSEANLMLLESQFYQEKFGFISKEEIQEINICLDSVFKIIMISRHYYAKSFHKYLVKINQEFYFPFQITSLKEDAEFMKINLLSEIYLFTHSKIVLVSFSIILQQKYFLIKVQINRQALINVMKNRQQLQIILTITNFQSLKTKIENRIIIQWFDLQQQMILYDDFRSYVLSVCTDRAKNKKIPSIMIDFFRKRLVLKYHPIFLWQVQFKKNRIAVKKPNIQEICSTNDFTYKKCKIQAVQNYCQTHIPSQKQIKLQNINKIINKQKPKQQIKSQKRKTWKQQRRIGHQQYLFILHLTDDPITQQWIAQISITNRKSKTKNKMLFNHLDFNIISQNDQSQAVYQSNKTLYTCKNSSKLVSQVYTSLIELMNNISFHWNYHLCRPFFSKNGIFYRYNLRQQLHLQQIIAKRRQNKNIQPLTTYPLLQKFIKYCHMRIVKPVKVKSQFSFLTLRQNFIQDNSFWQIILQFPRKHTHYACFLRQQSMIFYISDHHRKQNQSKFFDSSLSISHLSRFQENLTISMSHADQQEVINYKMRILDLYSRNQIQVYEKNGSYFLRICDEEYQLQQRIISQFQPSQGFIYNVWVNKDRIQIDVHSYGDFDVSNSSFTDSELFNDYKKELLGSIELTQAFRFYEMENKDTNQDEDYLKRVCKFYFQCVKQQRAKQMNYLKKKQSEKNNKDDYYF